MPARQRPGGRWLVGLSALVALACCPPGPAHAQAPLPGAACPDVTIMGARGSGEPDQRATRGMGPSVFHMASRLRASLEADGEVVRLLPVSYEARSTDVLMPSRAQLLLGPVPFAASYYRNNATPFLRSIDEGITFTTRSLETVAAACQDTDVVMMGYSQGAMVMHQAQRRLDAAGSPAWDAVVGTVLLADGDRVPRTRARHFGDARNASGVRTSLRGNARRDVADPEVTVDICDEGDLVCDFSPQAVRGYRAALRVHTRYLDDRRKVLDEAVDWLARELRGGEDAPGPPAR